MKLFIQTMLNLVLLLSVFLAHAEGTMEKTGKKIDDAATTAAVNLKYAKDTDLSAIAIDVDTNNGVVTLTGNVDSDTQRDRAIEIAKETENVSDVIDNLTVQASAHPVEDAGITTKVKAMLIKNKVFDKEPDAWTINVETKNGIVYLTGEVDSADEKTKLVDLVKSVEDVKGVEENLTVSTKSKNK